MSIWSSINCPTVICSPTTLLFFSREATSEIHGPGFLLNHICLRDLFLFAFIFRSINPKTPKYFAALYFICDLFIQSIITFLPPRTNFWHRTRKGLKTLLTRRVARSCYFMQVLVTLCCLVLPSSITLVSYLREIPTAAMLHHPFLFGEIPT